MTCDVRVRRLATDGKVGVGCLVLLITFSHVAWPQTVGVTSLSQITMTVSYISSARMETSSLISWHIYLDSVNRGHVYCDFCQFIILSKYRSKHVTAIMMCDIISYHFLKLIFLKLPVELPLHVAQWLEWRHISDLIILTSWVQISQWDVCAGLLDETV
jgi:hypothetical protein